MAGSGAFRVLFATSVLAVALAQACGSDEPSVSVARPVPSSTERVTRVVGASGGTVATPDGKAAVDIPEGALPGETSITIQPNATAPVPSSAYVVGTAYTFGPDGLTFLKPVTVTLGFDPARIHAGATAKQIVVFTAPEGSTAYVPLPTSVKDATHVSATTTHFSTDVPGIVTPDAATDAGVDAPLEAGACYVTCSTSPSASPVDASTDGEAGTTSPPCACEATCDGHVYEMNCTSSSCTCTKDGIQTATTSGQCGSSQQDLAIYNGGCGFPGELQPPPECNVLCNAASSPAFDASDEGGASGTTSCGCSTAACKGHAYAMTCTNDTCTCKTDGNVTKSGTSTNACSKAFQTYTDYCGFEGNTSSGDGGASSAPEGGASSKPDAGMN